MVKDRWKLGIIWLIIATLGVVASSVYRWVTTTTGCATCGGVKFWSIAPSSATGCAAGAGVTASYLCWYDRRKVAVFALINSYSQVFKRISPVSVIIITIHTRNSFVIRINSIRITILVKIFIEDFLLEFVFS